MNTVDRATYVMHVAWLDRARLKVDAGPRDHARALAEALDRSGLLACDDRTIERLTRLAGIIDDAYGRIDGLGMPDIAHFDGCHRLHFTCLVRRLHEALHGEGDA